MRFEFYLSERINVAVVPDVLLEDVVILAKLVEVKPDMMGRIKMYGQKTGCLECGEPLERYEGRTDRKFCCQQCKNRYHYKEVRVSRNIKARITSQLDRNHEVLDGLLKLGITTLDRTEATLLGMDLNVMTACHSTRGHTECSCYDITYRITETKVCNISKCLTTFAPSKNK